MRTLMLRRAYGRTAKTADPGLATDRWNSLVKKELKGKDPEGLIWHTAEVATQLTACFMVIRGSM